MEESNINESSEFVLVPRKEYGEFIRARMAIDTIAASANKYGFDSDVIEAVMKVFGYARKEVPDAE